MRNPINTCRRSRAPWTHLHLQNWCSSSIRPPSPFPRELSAVVQLAAALTQLRGHGSVHFVADGAKQLLRRVQHLGQRPLPAEIGRISRRLKTGGEKDENRQ